MADWHRKLIAETRALQGLPPTIADDPVGVELAARFLTPATPAASSLCSATDRVDAAGIGAAGHDVASGSGGCGEVAPLPATRAVGTPGRSNS